VTDIRHAHARAGREKAATLRRRLTRKLKLLRREIFVQVPSAGRPIVSKTRCKSSVP
jgi:hypothetical protein